MSKDKIKIRLEKIKMCKPIPLNDKDYKKFDDMFMELVAYYGSAKNVPGVYVSAKSNTGPLAFMLDTNKDIPDKVKDILNKYKPVLQEVE